MTPFTRSISTFLYILFFIQSCNSVAGHYKNHTTHRRQPDNDRPPTAPNESDKELHQCDACEAQASIDALFMQWIQFVGTSGMQSQSHSQSRYQSRRSNTSKFPTKSQTTRTIVVDKNPQAGEFSCIQDAIDSIPLVNFQPCIIKINSGVYMEKIYISAQKWFITLEGAGADKTIIQGGTDHTSNQGAFSSCVLGVDAQHFAAKNITFQNLASAAAATVAGVAARISGDSASFLGCRFLGAHNTLYDHIGRHYYKECHVEGGMDFLFGQALSMFEGCSLKASPETAGEVNLHTRSGLTDNSGMSFNNCKLMGAALFYLGKTWGSFSRVVLTNSYLDHIDMPKGIVGHQSALFQKGLNLLFGVHKCSGPGLMFASKKSWAKELTANQAMPFASLKFIQGHAWANF